MSRSFRPRAALSCVVPRAAGAGPPAAGCRPARRGVGRVYAGRYHAGRSSTRRRHEAFPTAGGSRSRRFLPRQRHTVPSDYEVQFEGFPDRTDRIGLLTDSTRMSAVPGMRIYTHTAAGACRRLGLLQGWFATALDLVRVLIPTWDCGRGSCPHSLVSGMWDSRSGSRRRRTEARAGSAVVFAWRSPTIDQPHLSAHHTK